MRSHTIIRSGHRAFAALLVLGAGALGFGCQDPPPTDLYTGYVEAELVYVAAPSSGWLIGSTVQEGDIVVADDLLFDLESELQGAQLEEATERLRQTSAQARDLTTGAREEEIESLQGQLAEAQAAVTLASAERRRFAALVKEGIAAQERADQAIAAHEAAQARVRTLEANIEVARLAGRKATREAAAATADAAEAAVRQARWRLDQRRVEARVGGRVEELFHRVGEFVSAGAPVLSLLPNDALEVRFFVPQADLSRLAPGVEVQVLVDGAADPAQAHVTFVASLAEFTPPVIYSNDSREKLVYLIKARLHDASLLRPGQPVDVRLP